MPLFIICSPPYATKKHQTAFSFSFHENNVGDGYVSALDVLYNLASCKTQENRENIQAYVDNMFQHLMCCIASKLQNSWKHERKKDTYSFNSNNAKKTNHGCPGIPNLSILSKSPKQSRQFGILFWWLHLQSNPSFF
jgi:hypothetical protein